MDAKALVLAVAVAVFASGVFAGAFYLCRRERRGLKDGLLYTIGTCGGYGIGFGALMLIPMMLRLPSIEVIAVQWNYAAMVTGQVALWLSVVSLPAALIEFLTRPARPMIAMPVVPPAPRSSP